MILFLADKYPPDIGGVAASGGRISATMARLGHTVSVVTLTRELASGSVERRDLGERLTLYRLGQSKNLDFSLQQAQTFLEWLHDKNHFTLCWGHFVGTAGFLAAWFGRLHSIPSLLAVRGNDFDRQVFPPGDLARLLWCLQKADHLVAVSKDLANKVFALVDRRPVVLPNAVDLTTFGPGPGDETLARRYKPAGECLLGFSGELRAKKGLPFLLEALAEVRRVRPARLLVIGEVRPGDQGEFERTRIGLGLDDAIVATGHLSNAAEVAAHLRIVDVFLLPSLWEGMPNGLLEAMAVGCPVIASDAGGITEIIRDGDNGLVIPRTHLQRLGRRILDYLGMSEQRREQLREAGLATVRESHSTEVEEANLAALLGGIAKSSS